TAGGRSRNPACRRPPASGSSGSRRAAIGRPNTASPEPFRSPSERRPGVAPVGSAPQIPSPRATIGSPHPRVPGSSMKRRITGILLAALCLLAGVATAQTPLPSIAEKTRGMERLDGFLPLYWEALTGKLWLEIPRLEEELIFVVSLPAGLGSNDVGLDRGQLGGER